MFQQPFDFRDESESLYQVLATLSDADFERTTQFKSWTVHDVVSHLHAWNWAADLALTNPAGFDEFRSKFLAEIGKGRRIRAVETDWLDGAKNRARLEQWRAFYLATLGGAASLYLDDRIGNFDPGKEADFVVLDPAATPLMARRVARTETLAEKLFALMILGDDRAVHATHVLGEARYRQTAA